MANTIQGQRTVVKDIEDKEGRHCKTCRKTLSVDLFYKRKNQKKLTSTEVNILSKAPSRTGGY